MTVTKHFEEILECFNNKFHCPRILVNKEWGPTPATILQIYKQCLRSIFEYGIVSTITFSKSAINNIQRVQNSFIRLALRLPKYVSAPLIHEASGLPYVRERLVTLQNSEEWKDNIGFTLFKHGFGYLWLQKDFNQNIVNQELHNLVRRIKDCTIQNYFSVLKTQSKMRTYIRYKHEFSMEPKLHFKARQQTSKLKLSDHNL